MKTIHEIKVIGRSRFQGRYWACVGAYALVVFVLSQLSSLISTPVQLNIQLSDLADHAGDLDTLMTVFMPLLTVTSVVAMAVSLTLGGPLRIGLNYFFVQIVLGRHDRAKVFTPFPQAFKGFGRKLGGYLWMQLFIFLWSLLLWIPGIIKSYSYALTPYILCDCPNVRAQDALKLSMRIMHGKKFDLFVFLLSFLGWNVLSVLTLGILDYFYVGPWQSSAMACWYLEAREDALRSGVVTMAELEGVQPVL